MKWVVLSLGFIFIFSCSSQKTIDENQSNNQAAELNESNIIEESGSPPIWLNSPMSGCMKGREICAVGEGTGAIVAELNARKSLARIFESQIKSQTTISQHMNQESDADSIISGRNLENVESRIEEITDQVLQGVEVKKIYRSTESVYTLVGLDRYEAANRIKVEITSIDDKMQAIYQEKSRSSYFRLMKSFALREKLNKRYHFLTGTLLPQIVSYEQIQAIKREFSAKPVTVKLELRDKSKLKEFSQQISQMLLDFQYKVVMDKDRQTDFVVGGNIGADQQHLKVDGFVRYKFAINIFSKNADGQKVGSLKFDTTKTGRSFRHAYESAVPEITQFIEDHFNELNID